MNNNFVPKHENPFENEGFKVSSITRYHEGAIRRCVAVKITESTAEVRDTKDANSATLTFTKEEWFAFVQGVKNGEFDM